MIRSGLLLTMCLATIFTACALALDDTSNGAGVRRPRPLPPAVDFDACKHALLELANEFRRNEDRGVLSANAQLAAAAREFAEYMAKEHKFGHEADGRTPAERATEHGYYYCLVLENIGWNYDSRPLSAEELATRFQEGWEQSPSHRANLLDPDVEQLGVGLARGPTGYYFAVQLFGRHKSRQIEFSLYNATGTTVWYKTGEETLELPPRFTMRHQACRAPQIDLLREPPRPAEPQAEQVAETAKAVVIATIKAKHGGHYVVVRQAGKLKIVERSRRTS